MPTDRTRSNEHQRDGERRRATEQSAHEQSTPAHPILRLQQQIGNRAVARMLAQQQDTVQRATLEEEEALQTVRDPALQRMTSVQLDRDAPEVGLEGGPISAGLTQRIQSKRGGGSPIPDSTRSKMEAGFGTNFDHVRLHTDSESASISRSLGAKAATTGSDIFFGKGATPGDSNLLAHELTHVVQQSSMRGSGSMTVNKDGDSHEAEANRMASAVTSSSMQRTAEDEL